METDYNKDYRTRENDGFSDIDPLKPKKKPSFLTILLIGLCVLLVCSLGYDNFLKPYLEKKSQKTENPVASGDTDVYPTPVATQSQRNPTAEPIGNQTRNNRKDVTSTPSRTEDNTKLTASEILDRKAHANAVKQAQRAGVSTEGSTSEILDRIAHASVVKQAQRAGVSTEGSISEILDRIAHANVVKQAQRAGVSTEGTTSEILERISHANVVKRAKRAGVSTEGSTSEISERIFRKNMERRGY